MLRGERVEHGEPVGLARGRGLRDIGSGHRGGDPPGATEQARRPALGGGRLPEARQRVTGCACLPVATLAARAQRPVGGEGPVPDLGREAVRAAVDASVRDDPAADAGSQRHDERVVDPARRAMTELTPCGRVRVVVDEDGNVENVAELVAQRRVDEPGNVGRETHDPGAVDEPGGADAERDRLTGARIDPVHQPDDRGDHRPRAAASGVASRSSARMWPSPDTTAARTFVPPRSTPIVLPEDGAASDAGSGCVTRQRRGDAPWP